jgi:hypothetical protein
MHEQHVAREAAEKAGAQTAGICLGCGQPLMPSVFVEFGLFAR